jgi:hypothetical protein
MPVCSFYKHTLIFSFPFVQHDISWVCSFQVHKQGIALGRSVDLTKFNDYKELISELDGMFDFNGELKSSNKEWMVVYTDNEGDMMLVGDDPWK